MKKNIHNTIFAIAAAAATFISCDHGKHFTATVSDIVINADFFGNGVEWDPYDESISWSFGIADADKSGTTGCDCSCSADNVSDADKSGTAGNDCSCNGNNMSNACGLGISDADWEKLHRRMDCLQPQYVRCMINSPYLYFEEGKFVPERNSRNIKKLLSWCEKNSVSVIYGEFNPPDWSMKDSEEWVEMSVKYLNWLVEDNGFRCIRNFVIFNEPDGNWASTDGDFGLWKEMYDRFHKEMLKYPSLASVELAGPDAVLNYTNPASDFDSYGWVAETASELDSLTGIYDIHCYPGQHYVRSGEFAEDMAKIRSIVPKDKRFIFGEGGFKYHNPEDSTLMKEYWRRVEKTPFTDGSDCNMLVTDWFYALDMPIFAIEAMNNGASGVAAWMLDDAMHSNGDSGQPKDIKIWGMWNILGEEVFGDASLEEIRPWFYTWAMICRCFPSGCDIVKINTDLPEGVFAAASKTRGGKRSAVFVNITDSDITADVSFPKYSSSIDTCTRDNHNGSDRISTDLTASTKPEHSSDKKCQKVADSYRAFTFTKADISPIIGTSNEYCQITEIEFNGNSDAVKIPAMSFVAVTSQFNDEESPFASVMTDCDCK